MKNVLLFSICLCTLQATGQKLTIDLSKNVNSTFTQTIDPMVVSDIELINKLLIADAKYDIEVRKQRQEPLPIEVGGFLGSKKDACKALDDAKQNLSDESDETNMPEKIKALKSEMERANAATCAKELAAAASLISATRGVYSIIPITIKEGDQLTVTVKRGDKVWTYIYKTERVEHGKLFYGFTYAPEKLLSRFSNYYAKEDGSSNFIITRMSRSSSNILSNISPTIMYSHLFFKKPDAAWKFGMTGGFMLDFENPSAMIGPSLSIGDNLLLTTGLGVIQKYALRGQYESGQRLQQTLDFDQLHEKVWTPEIFFSLAFRFDRNPFKKDKKTAGEPTGGTEE